MNNTQLEIDGYILGTTNDFAVTIDYVREMFDKFNDRYFNNQLFLDNSIKVKVYPYKNVLGSVAAQGTFNKRTGQCNAYVTAFHISNYYNRSEVVYCNTILHEMIHIYQYQVLNVNDGHGYSFIKKMKEINSFGWSISVTETIDERNSRGDKNQSILDKEAKKLQKTEQENNLDNYVLAVWVPENATSIKGDESTTFQILDKDVTEKHIKLINLAMNPRYSSTSEECYLFSMSDSSKTAQTLKKGGYFEKRYRLSNDYIMKKASDSVQGIESSMNFVLAILRRSYSLPYNMIKTDEEQGMLKSINDTKLPPIEYGIRESINSVNLNKRINTAEDFVDAMEQDPFIDVLHAKDLGGFIEFESIIS